MQNNNSNALLWGVAGVAALVAARALLNNAPKLEFRGKTVAITGGSRGFGLVLARLLAQEGARLAICARDADELDAARLELTAMGAEVFTHVTDLTESIGPARFINEVEDQFGAIDVLANNAGVIMAGPAENITEQDVTDALNLNFWAAYRTTEAVLPLMRERGAGRIVNIASIGGKVAVPHLLPYTISKFALVGYSETLRSELKKDGIYVTTVCPGLMRTGSPRQALVRGQHEKEYAWFKIADSLPLLTVSAEHCAKQVMDATRRGQAELIVSLPAKILALLHGIAPGLTADVLGLVNTLLPNAVEGGTERLRGAEAESDASQSFMTKLTEKAAERNNQLIGG